MTFAVHISPELMGAGELARAKVEAAIALNEVAAMLGAPDRWTVAALARDANGYPVAPLDPDARKWCLLGALQKVAIDRPAVYSVANRALARQVDAGNFAYFNDHCREPAQVTAVARQAADQLFSEV